MKKVIITLSMSIFFVALAFCSSAIAVSSDSGISLSRSNEGRTVAIGKDLFTFKHTFENTLKDVSIIEITHPPHQGLAFLLKKHTFDVAGNFYVISGEFEFFGIQSNDSIQVRAGDFVHVQPGIVHSYRHIGAELGKVLVVTASTGFQDFLEEVGTWVADPTIAPSPTRRPDIVDIEKIVSIAKKHGIKFFN
ncbi:MAG: hypothetical protein N4J56_006643 [Chroococcidiopsis sp. SAG 2025]|uniref:cupin domain-containing protein n=1 Tax=Chroococcidiopsis sp. SAG 2025 TaxID=171389 RepID=UPI00293701BB|nr:cupin domain-containing protein [Chroococcidiopsis sp. SAG 2025]MDV2996938.1 hypothetical protein [Chroococcidiopsis sp. SAG 2025]